MSLMTVRVCGTDMVQESLNRSRDRVEAELRRQLRDIYGRGSVVRRTATANLIRAATELAAIEDQAQAERERNPLGDVFARLFGDDGAQKREAAISRICDAARVLRRLEGGQ